MTVARRAGACLIAVMAVHASSDASSQIAPIEAAKSARQAIEKASGQQQPPSPPASAGQPPPPQGATAGQGGSPASKTDLLIEPPGFAYNPEGRWDPFVSLLRRGADPRGTPAARPAGLAGLAVGEATLKGTVRSRDGFVAILQGADQKAYIVRPGDKLFDGTVRAVTQNDVVILQQVNDPLSLEKQREVRKVLRQTEAN